MLFIHKNTEIPIKRFMEILVTYRGNMPTTVKHMVDMQSFSRYHIYEGIRYHAHKTEELMNTMDVAIEKMASLLATSSTAPPLSLPPPPPTALPPTAPLP